MRRAQLHAVPKRGLERPAPPARVLAGDRVGDFQPCDRLKDWARATFIDAHGALANEEHGHLEHATLGFLWTNALYEQRGRRVLGTCEKPGDGRGSWISARLALQIRDWFGFVPDFIITIDAMAADVMSDRAFCALVEHELYHAGQAHDEHGAPAFTKAGRPKFELRPHDLQEFTGVLKRYGGFDCQTEDLVAALRRGPRVDDGDLWGACGACKGRVAA